MGNRHLNDAKITITRQGESPRCKTMTSRERVRAALNHENPDTVPIDFGGTDITGIHVSTYRKLQAELGLPDTIPRAYDTFQMLAEIEEPIRQFLGVDVVGLTSPYTVFGYRNENWKPFTLFDGTEVLISGNFNTIFWKMGILCNTPGEIAALRLQESCRKMAIISM